MSTRKENEKKFGNWRDNPDGSRYYWYTVEGKRGWKAKYVKEVDLNEITISFYQEIYNAKNELVEIHRKFPIDEGHKKLR